mgnify:CR=1 FL=1
MNKGLYIFSIGLAKKVIIADTIANFANVGFDMMDKLNFIEAWLTSISYTLQLYFDFSGYCDMAMGIGLMFNIVLPVNFNSPYKSTNIQEFWKRWHITLGRFMTNYLYIPLGGNRKGEVKTLRNLFVVFLASGIWHGAGWNFVIWGMLHGVCILVHRIWKNSGRKLNKLVGWFITMNLVNIFWVFFRAETVSNAMKVIKGMFNVGTLKKLLSLSYKEYASIGLGNKISFVFLVMAGLIVIFLPKNSMELCKKLEKNSKTTIIIVIFMSLGIIFINRVSKFLYFNF